MAASMENVISNAWVGLDTGDGSRPKLASTGADAWLDCG
jgi:hypothetical protein